MKRLQLELFVPMRMLILNKYGVIFPLSKMNKNLILSELPHRYPTTAGKGGLFPIFARFNHSCAQNVTHHFEEGYRRVFAARDICCGEELLNSYIYTAKNRQLRFVSVTP